jgi:hypothetical protein
MAPADPMELPLEAGSPSSRRNKGKIAEAIQSMGNLNSGMDTLDLPTDPDAQATVTDFLDFTEYLPSDMIRSLTLIGNLDQTYCDASANVDDLAKIYGKLPDMPTDEKPDLVKLRADISQNLSEAVSARTLSHAEAMRMADNVDRHYNRAKNILAKLQTMLENYPPTREPSPVPKAKSPTLTKAPKITLRLDGARGAGDHGVARVHKHRAPRITVPGEVLAPYELDYESYGTGSDSLDSEDDEPLTPRATPGGSLGAGRIKLKVRKQKKEKAPKPARGPRPPGLMGTNVHSAVAGISTSNALAMIKPPPADAVRGDEHLPWLQLNAYELALLRKRMKKNAIWSPSDTMIARELKQLGRGIENYRAAKAKAEAEGLPFDQPQPPQLRGETVHADGAISVEALRAEEPQTSNRGMKLNEAKKLKKENQAKELAKQAAEEAEESARKMAEAAKAMKGIFGKSPLKDEKDKKGTVKTPSKTPARKRKRESPAPEAEAVKAEEKLEGEPAAKLTRPPLKRSKTETPIPPPHPIATKQATPLAPLETAPSVESEPASVQTPTEAAAENLAVPVLLPSPKKSSTPILPPTKERKGAKKETKRPEPIVSTRPRRTSGAPTPTPAPEPLPAKRPTSSRSKAASLEPAIPTPTATATIDRPRRASTARNTPAPEPRQPSKRAKRPAPGVVTAGSEGSAAVSIGKRRAATRKKAGAKKEKKDGREGSAAQDFVEVDDEGNVIDPDEPRYCNCNRVSFGNMICCDNNDVSYSRLEDIKNALTLENSVTRNGSIGSVSALNRNQHALRSGIVLNVGLLLALARRDRLMLGERRCDTLSLGSVM